MFMEQKDNCNILQQINSTLIAEILLLCGAEIIFNFSA